MGINELTTLSTNPHFYAFLLQNFLSGYGKPCDVRIPFIALPILLYSESRDKLSNANSRSKLESIFSSPVSVNSKSISGKTRLSGFIDRYNMLLEGCKGAIIILSSENKVAIHDTKIVLIQKLEYKDYESNIRVWSKSSYYLGVIFAKTDRDHLFYYLGVSMHE